MIHKIDDRDLKNIMRHMYLLGANDGYIYAHKRKTPPDIISVRDREQSIAEILSYYKKDGYMDYNDDPGSHDCTKECKKA